jgi:hypothetical protein
MTTARLRVWLMDDPDLPPSIDRELAIGHLDPVDTISGVQARLAHLGYRCPRSGTLTPEDPFDPTLSAIQAFRASQSLPAIELPVDEEPVDGDDQAPKHDGDTKSRVHDYVESMMDKGFRDTLIALYEAKG